MDVEQIINQLDKDRLKLDERETVFSQTADDRNTWRVFSNDEIWIRRLAKKGARLVSCDEYGVSFDLDNNQVRIFLPLTPDQRARMAASLRY